MGSRKIFSQFAHGLVRRFVSRNNDIDGYWGVGVISKLTHRAHQGTASIDLLSQYPRLDGGSGEWLRSRMLVTETRQSLLSAASIQIDFVPSVGDFDDSDWRAWGTTIPGVQVYRVDVAAILTDDRGREWSAMARTWCRDHDPAYELRSLRANVGAESKVVEASRCRVCGLISTVLPWGLDGRHATFDFCDCCGVEFGYQDGAVAAARAFREKWVDAGLHWENPRGRPAGWSWPAQQRDIPGEWR